MGPVRDILLSVDLRVLELGAVVARTTQAGPALDDVGRLYLVCPRPGGRTWLVGILHRPTYDGKSWKAEPNVVPLTDVSRIVTAGGPPRDLTDDESAALHAAITAGRPLAPAPAPGATFDPPTDRWELGARDADGLRIGPWRTWRRDGTPWVEEDRVGGAPDGLHRQFHADGALAIEARWAHGHLQSAVFHAPAVPTDVPGFDDVPAGVAAWEEDGDGEYGVRTVRWLDREGRAVTAAGLPLPPRPHGVPDTARYEDRPGTSWSGWVDGVIERATRRPLGVWRWWTPSGALARVQRHDARGRLRSAFDTVGPDPREAAIATFLADPAPFGSRYDLARVWDEHVHQHLVEALDRHPPDRLSRYLSVLAEDLEQYGRGAAWKVARPDLGWALIQPRLVSLDAPALVHALGWAAALHDLTRLAELWTRWLAGPIPHLHQELEPGVCAALDGTSGAALDRHLAALRRGESVPVDAFRALATRELGALGLEHLVGETAPDVLLVDPQERAFGWDGQGFGPLPLRVDQRGPDLGRYLGRHDRIDERVVRWSGKGVWWATLRFGTSIWLQGSSYYASRGQSEVVRDVFVECPTLAWTRRIEAMFAAEAPKSAVVVDPFYHPKLKSALVRGYYGRFGDRSVEWSRGVHGADQVDAGGSPELKQLEMKEGKPGPVRIASYPSAEDARHAFDRIELRWLAQGHYEQRITALPMPPLETTPSPAPRVRAPRRVPPVAPSAERVDVELRRALPGDRSATLGAVREAWAKRPAPELADALDRLGDAGAAPGLTGKTKAALARWDEAEATRDPAVVPALAATLGDAPASVVADRLERLAAWPEDPRVDRAVVELAYAIPFTATSTLKAWRRMFDRLAASRDARILPRLRELPERYSGGMGPGEKGWAKDRVEKLLEARGALLEACGALELHPDDRALLAALLQPQPPDGAGAEPDLIAEILAAPADRGLRERYVERFGATGDIRAELITLQLQPKPDKAARARIKAIEREHAAELAGPLARGLKAGSRFALGFLSECALRSGSDAPVDSPYWSTVEALDANFCAEIAASPRLASLRTLRQVRPSSAWPERPHLASLQVALNEPDDLRTLGAARLPALRELEIALRRPHLAELDVSALSGPLGRGLHTLGWTREARGGPTSDATMVVVLGRVLPLLPELPQLQQLWAKVEYGYFTATYTFTRAEAGFELMISAPPQRHLGWWDVFEDNVAALLLGLEGTVCRSVRFDVRATDPAALLARLAAIDGISIDVRGIAGVA